MSYPFKTICIVYNPVSTGPSKTNALALKTELSRRLKNVNIFVRETEAPGHGERIAAEYARKSDKVLIVSASGDGGYNELINGVLLHDGTSVTTCVLPSGNANDHATTTAQGDTLEQIIRGEVTHIDVLHVSGTIDGKKWERYAHSYIGIGASPIVGREVNKRALNPLNEKWIVLKYLFQFGYVQLKVRGRIRRFSSVIFSNIPRMAKMMRFVGETRIDDGKMEVYITRRRSPWLLLLTMLRAATIGIQENTQTFSYKFETLTPTSIQLDGEVFVIDEKSLVKITCVKQRLSSIL